MHTCSLQTIGAGKVQEEEGCAIPLLRGVEGCVLPLHEHTPPLHKPARPLSREEFAGARLQRVLNMAERL